MLGYIICFLVYFGQMLKSDKLMLKDRVLKTSSSISLLVPLAPLPNRWLDGCMEKVMATVKDQGFSVRRAAEEYAIPKSTVHDRVSGRVLAGVGSGPPKYLTCAMSASGAAS